MSDEEVDWNNPPPEEIDWTPPRKVTTTLTHYDPTEGMSTFDKAMAGAGKAQVDMWHGIRQIFGAPGAQEDIDEAARLDKPLMRTGAGLAGYAGGAIADTVIPAGLAGDAARAAGLSGTASALSAFVNPGTFTAGAASGAIQGALQPVETGGSRLWNTASNAAGGLVGQGLARGVNAVGAAAGDLINDASGRAVKALADAGVPLDAAQRTGSILLQRAKAMLSDNPLTAGAQKDFEDMQKRAFTKAVLSTIGEKGTAATPEVMGGAMTRMGNTYDQIASRVSIPYDNIEPQLAHIENQARLTLNDSQFGTVQRNLNDIVQKASQSGGNIEGAQFSNLKKTLDTLSGGSDSDVAEVARDIRQTLHQGLLDSAKAQGNEADAKLLQQTNQQWGNMRKIEGALDKEGNGQISPARLANVMYQKGNRYISVYGRGDTSLSDLANAGNALLGSKTPQSGTVPRALAQLGVAGAVGSGEAIYEGKQTGDWSAALKKGALYGAGAYAIPKAIQLGLNAQGAGAQRAMTALGTLGERPELPATIGGALQHAPAGGFEALSQLFPNRPDKRSKEQAEKAQ